MTMNPESTARGTQNPSLSWITQHRPGTIGEIWEIYHSPLLFNILEFCHDSEALGLKLQILPRLHCVAIPRRDLSTKKTKPNIEE